MAWSGPTALSLTHLQPGRAGLNSGGQGAARTAPAAPPPRTVPAQEAALLGAPRWGRSSPVRYPFKPGRDGSYQRQPRLARDVAARQAAARSEEQAESRGGGGARARRVPSPPTVRPHLGPGEWRAAPHVMRRM